MKLVLDISRLLSVTTIARLLERIGEAAASLLQAEEARVLLHEPATAELWTITPAAGEIRVRPDPAILSQVMETAHVMEHGGDGLAPNLVAVLADGVEVESLISTPLRDLDQQTIGVMVALNKRRGRFSTEDRVSIDLLAEHAALAIQRFRLLLAATQGAELRKEMELAQQVQGDLIPVSAPRVPGLEAVGWTKAASITGGDCYDLWTLADGRLALFVADASGHGLAAALVISQVRAMMRALAELNAEPDWLLGRLNARLVRDLNQGRFVTAFFGCLAPDGWLQWSSAGQGPIFVRRGSGDRFEMLQALTIPLGVTTELATDVAPPLQLAPGGALAVVTDGFLEARNADGELFGSARMAKLLEGGAESAEAIVQRVRDTLVEWQGTNEPADDQTIVVVQRTS